VLCDNEGIPSVFLSTAKVLSSLAACAAATGAETASAKAVKVNSRDSTIVSVASEGVIDSFPPFVNSRTSTRRVGFARSASKIVAGSACCLVGLATADAPSRGWPRLVASDDHHRGFYSDSTRDRKVGTSRAQDFARAECPDCRNTGTAPGLPSEFKETQSWQADHRSATRSVPSC
jgi:hypothetical protein